MKQFGVPTDNLNNEKDCSLKPSRINFNILSNSAELLPQQSKMLRQ
jgi:hypothetical protein